jgi:hypothetical protein
MKVLKRWMWKQFLRIGHDLVWKADEWFQRQEEALRVPRITNHKSQITRAHIKCAGGMTNESNDGEHHENAGSERTEPARLGRRNGEGDTVCSPSESLAKRGRRTRAFADWRNDREAAEGAGTGDGGRAGAPGNRDRRPRRLRAKTGASDFDKRIVARRGAFAGMVLAKAQPMTGDL